MTEYFLSFTDKMLQNNVELAPRLSYNEEWWYLPMFRLYDLKKRGVCVTVSEEMPSPSQVQVFHLLKKNGGCSFQVGPQTAQDGSKRLSIQ